MTHARASLFLYSCKPLVNIGLKILKSSKKNYIIQIVPMKPKSLGAFCFRAGFFYIAAKTFSLRCSSQCSKGISAVKSGFLWGNLWDYWPVLNRRRKLWPTAPKSTKSCKKNILLHKTMQWKATGTTRENRSRADGWLCDLILILNQQWNSFAQGSINIMVDILCEEHPTFTSKKLMTQ